MRETDRDATKTTPVSAREARLGRTTAASLQRRRLMFRGSAVAWVLGVVATVAGVPVATSTRFGVVPFGTVVLLFGFVVISVVGIICAISFAAAGRRARFMAEGAAVSVLLPANPTLTAAMIAPHLRSIDEFDRWVLRQSMRPPVYGARLPQWRWSPGKVRTVLPGSSAFTERRAAGITGSIAMLVTFAIAIILVVDHDSLVRFRVLSVALVVALLAAAVVLRLAAESRAAAEYRAGYTTLTPVRHTSSRWSSWIEPDVRTGVDLVDPSSHSILRAAGAAALTVQESDRRRAVTTTK